MNYDLFELEGPTKVTLYDKDGNESGVERIVGSIGKKLVIINWHGEVHRIWTIAKNDKSALSNVITRLANKLGISYRTVYYYVTDPKFNRWEVK
jgi:hypothetical protein